MKSSISELKELFIIKNDVLIWNAPTRGKRINGNPAGCVNNRTGLLIVEVQGNPYPVSHVIWAMNYGNYPKFRIEYINGDKSDNRVDNLREIKPGSLVVTQELLQRIFTYKDGLLYWKEKPNSQSRVKIGEIAGFVSTQKDSEYRYIKIGGKRYKASNLVWMYHKNEMPKLILDHENHIKDDDRLENLREATSKENSKNSSLSSINTSGITGISWNKMAKRWVARINTDDGKRLHIGYFATLDLAVKARKQAEIEFGYHKNHGMERSL